MFLKKNIKILIVALSILTFKNSINAMENKPPIEFETAKGPKNNGTIEEGMKKIEEKIDKMEEEKFENISQDKINDNIKKLKIYNSCLINLNNKTKNIDIKNKIEEIENKINNLMKKYEDYIIKIKKNEEYINEVETTLKKMENITFENLSQNVVNDNIKKLETYKSDLVNLNNKTENIDIKNKIEEIENKINNLMKKIKKETIDPAEQKEIEEIEKYLNNMKKNNCDGNSTLIVFSENIYNIENLNKNILKLEQLEKKDLPKQIKEKITTLKSGIKEFKEKLKNEVNKKIDKKENIKKVLKEYEFNIKNKNIIKEQNENINQEIINIETNLNKIENISFENLSQNIVNDNIKKLENYKSDLINLNNKTKNVDIKNKIEETENRINNLIKGFKNSILIDSNLKLIEKEIPKIEENINNLKNQNLDDINNNMNTISFNLEQLNQKLEKLEKEESPKQIKENIATLKNTISKIQDEIKNKNEIFKKIEKIEQTDFSKINPDKIINNINCLKKYKEILKTKGYNLKEYLINLLTKQFENYISALEKENLNTLNILTIEDRVNFLKNYVKELQILKIEVDNINIKTRIDGMIKNSDIKIPNLLLELLKFYISKLEQKNYIKLSTTVIKIYLSKINKTKSDLIDIEKETLTNNVKIEINNLKNKIIELEKKIKAQQAIDIYLDEIEKIEQKDLNNLENKEFENNIKNLKGYLYSLIEIEKKLNNGKEEKEITEQINNLKNKICNLELKLNEKYITKLENKYSNKNNIIDFQKQIKDLSEYKLNLVDINSKSTENNIKNKFNILIKKIENIINDIKNAQNQKIENFLDELVKNLNNIKEQNLNNRNTNIIFNDDILDIESLNQCKLKLEKLEKEGIPEQFKLRIKNLKNNLYKTISKLKKEINNKIDEKDDLNFEIEQSLSEITKYLNNLESKNLNHLEIDKLKKIKNEINQKQEYLNNLNQITTNDVAKSNIALLQNKINILFEKTINEIMIKFSNSSKDIENKNYGNISDIQINNFILEDYVTNLNEFKNKTNNKEILYRIDILIKKILEIRNDLTKKEQQMLNEGEKLKLINSLEKQFEDFNTKYENITSHMKNLYNIISNIYDIKNFKNPSNNDSKLIDENILKGTIIVSNLDTMYSDSTKILDSIKKLNEQIYESDGIPLRGLQNHVSTYIKNKNKTEELKLKIENLKNFYNEAVKFVKNNS